MLRAEVALFWMLLLTACQSTPAAGPSPVSPGPTATGRHGAPAAIDYNSGLGSNRPAAEASVLLARALYQAPGFWETYLLTDPSSLTGAFAPGDDAALIEAGKSVKSLQVIMATESAVGTFRAGGHDHEKAILEDACKVLFARFPVQEIKVSVYYGEANLHARAVVHRQGGVDYTVLDQL
jgi:hypothetical protein